MNEREIYQRDKMIIENELYIKCIEEIKNNREYEQYSHLAQKDLEDRLFNNALENLYEYNDFHNDILEYSSMSWCVDMASEYLLEVLPKEEISNEEKVSLSDYMGIGAIVELGQLYKNLNNSWVYGDLEQFVNLNYKLFIEWWRTDNNDFTFCDTDDAVVQWWSITGKKLEVNKQLMYSDDHIK